MTDRRVLLYGDSNTFGTAPMQRLGANAVLDPGERWGDVMADALGDGWDVVIEGLPGRTTVFDDPVEGAYRNGLTVLPAILFSHCPIDLLVICLGTNDQKMRFGLGAQDIARGLMRLVHEARATGTVDQVMLIVPPPVVEANDLAEMFAGAEARCAGLAGQVARFAAEEDVRVLDAGAVISVDPTDGVHWAAASHRVLGMKVAETVQEIFA